MFFHANLQVVWTSVYINIMIKKDKLKWGKQKKSNKESKKYLQLNKASSEEYIFYFFR